MKADKVFVCPLDFFSACYIPFVLIHFCPLLGSKDKGKAFADDEALFYPLLDLTGADRLCSSAPVSYSLVKGKKISAVIVNAAGSTSLMERYLKEPPRMPEYRKGRSHKDFVTSLAEQGYDLSIGDFRAAIDEVCHEALNSAQIPSQQNSQNN